MKHKKRSGVGYNVEVFDSVFTGVVTLQMVVYSDDINVVQSDRWIKGKSINLEEMR